MAFGSFLYMSLVLECSLAFRDLHAQCQAIFLEQVWLNHISSIITKCITLLNIESEAKSRKNTCHFLYQYTISDGVISVWFQCPVTTLIGPRTASTAWFSATGFLWPLGKPLTSWRKGAGPWSQLWHSTESLANSENMRNIKQLCMKYAYY